MRKTTLIVLAATLIATSALAQVRVPRPSPKASLMQSVGITDITINYNRPGVKGRQIWGALVPYDKVWRTGANEATTIQFSDDVTINGQALKKGLYSLHTIPTAGDWTIIFNSVAEQWGSYSYDPARDALRITAKPEKAEFREWLTFEIPRMTTDEATVLIRWENVAVPFTVNTNSTQRALTALKNAMKPSWQNAYSAASFAWETGAASQAEINQWLDESLKVNENIANLWLKARIQQKAGQTAEARKTAEAAIAKATPQQKDFADEIRRQVAGWK